MPDHSPMILLASADARGELPELHQEVSHLDSLFQAGRRDIVERRGLHGIGPSRSASALVNCGADLVRCNDIRRYR